MRGVLSKLLVDEASTYKDSLIVTRCAAGTIIHQILRIHLGKDKLRHLNLEIWKQNLLHEHYKQHI